jgi:two-component system, OmpR family, phosphate regulon sensor histidine kinase PhoR
LLRLRPTDILLTGLLGSGLALTAWDAATGNTAHGLGQSMVAVAGGWAVVSLLRLRSRCLKLAKTLDDAGNAKLVEPAALAKAAPDALGVALGESLAAARRSAVEAELHARELQIRLKMAEAEREHAEAIIYSISDAVVVTDPSDDVVLANESAARAFKFELDGAKKVPVRKVVRDPKLLELIRNMRQAGGKAERQVVEHQLKTEDSTRTYKVTLCPVVTEAHTNVGPANDSPSEAGVVAVLHDVTHEREIAQLKNDFVSNVSHELRTPLASIRAYVELLIDGEAQDETTKREFYDIIQNEANRLSRLIDNVLNLSKIEAGVVKVYRRPQSLTGIVEDAVDIILPQAQRKRISIKHELTPAIYQTSVDRDMMYQAVLNLLSNAVKYTSEGGEVCVETTIDEGRRKVITRVKDSGVGIPQKDLPFIFDKFYRSESTSAMAHGTGLGLPLVKHIVETVHRGRVFVESQAGRGSCFGFELSLCE